MVPNRKEVRKKLNEAFKKEGKAKILDVSSKSNKRDERKKNQSIILPSLF
jgi:hypothetical protein